MSDLADHRTLDKGALERLGPMAGPMRICVAGLTQGRGLPLALVLRHYGRHSVVGLSNTPRLDMQTQEAIAGHPEREVREMLQDGPIPTTYSYAVAIREGADLAIVADSPIWVARILSDLAAVRAAYSDQPLPVVIVTPIPDRHVEQTLRIPPGSLAVGYAPFKLPVTHAAGRLLTLRAIQLDTPHQLVRDAVARAWRPIDNTIPIGNGMAPTTGLAAPS